MAAPRGDNIRENILDKTIQLMQSKSFSDITLADISAAAGISKGTLYYYYRDKDDILFDVADIYLNRLADDLVGWADNREKDTSAPRLINYTFQRGIFNESGPLRIYLIAAAISGHEDVRQRLIEKYRFFSESLSARIAQRRPDADPDYTAWLILTIMDGLLVQDQLGNPDLDIEAFIRKTVELLT